MSMRPRRVARGSAALGGAMASHQDGVVQIYAVTDGGESGGMPKKVLTLRHTLRYDERTVGVTRMYAAKQANAQIDYLLRCPRLRDVNTQDVAIPNDGQQYAITDIQYPDDVQPPVMDLTLQAVKHVYPITGV